MKKEVRTALQSMNLVDRFLFDETMEVKEAYQAVISILLENEIELLGETETEKELRVSPELRSVRLDIISMDKAKKIYFTEMQKSYKNNLRRRSRYYQAQVDVSLLEPGSADFNKLNDTVMIFISSFDIFGEGLYRYTFENTCRECPKLRLEDGTKKVFINTRGKNRQDFSDEFLWFMEYLEHSTAEVAARADSERIRLIHRCVENVKHSEKAGVRYMQKWEEIVYEREDAAEKATVETTNRINKLNTYLIRDRRIEDLERSSQDMDYQRALFAEYDIV